MWQHSHAVEKVKGVVILQLSWTSEKEITDPGFFFQVKLVNFFVNAHLGV